MRYVHTYVDRHGRPRNYFRRGGLRVRLPDQIDSAKFRKAYDAVLSRVPQNVRDKVITEKLERERVRLRRKQPDAGVYLLIHGDNIVYIGSSLNTARRIADHRRNGRPFDRAYVIGTAEDEREALEAILIRSIQPAQNRAGKNGTKTAEWLPEPTHVATLTIRV
jgi:hypothetical protein